MKIPFAYTLVLGILGLGLIQTAEGASRKEVKPPPQSAAQGTSVLTVGATIVPHAAILGLVKDDLAAQNIELKIVEFTDYVMPNSALIAGDLDANFFQHLPFLEENPTWKAALSPAFGVHVEPLGLYSNLIKTIEDLKDGASIAIPNDPSNGGRALLLLQSKGFITLNPAAGLKATPRDITDNPKNLKFHELEAAQLPRSLGDVDAAVINGNYALEAGFNPLEDALIIEGAESPYINYLVVRKGDEEDPRIKALEAVLCSQKVKDYINKTWNGSVRGIF
ncbi:MAG: MetQ/NlpA family ABC transporter substrate-binding protein [Treponema sp.]|jgi:D-methionine transport system substrate-binding protein|nr:MetQ/NlpA family ABC transporter substrate-binding protein [Treponema sp.]